MNEESSRHDYGLELDRLFAGADDRPVLLLGGPASGKTHVLKEYTRRARERGDLVVLIHLRALTDPRDILSIITDQVLEWLEGSSDQRHADEIASKLRKLSVQLAHGTSRDPTHSISAFLRLLESSIPLSPRVVIIMDGLDEVADPERFLIVFEQLASLEGNARLILSSRPASVVERVRRVGSQAFHVLELRESFREEVWGSLLSFWPDADSVQRALNQLDLEAVPLTLSEFIPFVFEKGLDEASAGDFSRADLERLISMVAVFHPISVDSLAQLMRLSPDTAEQMVAKICSPPLSVLVVTSARGVEMVHPTFREFVLEKIAGGQEVDIPSLQFGSEEAEQDNLLAEIFVRRPGLSGILSCQKTIVLGDRGSGKSAIFRVINGLEHSRQATVGGCESEGLPEDTIPVAADDPSSFLQKTLGAVDSEHTPERFRAFWLLYAAALIATRMVEEDEKDGANQPYYSDARRILQTVGWEKHLRRQESKLNKVWQRAKSILAGGVRFSIGPVTIEFDRPFAGLSGTRTLDITQFIITSQSVLEQKGLRMLLLIDRIDEIFKYQRTLQEALVQGLFLAEAHIAQSGTVRLSVFLRTDLFEIYDIQEKNKFVSRCLPLSWTERDLLCLMVRRLYSNAQLRRVADLLGIDPAGPEFGIGAALRVVFPEYIEQTPFREWLFSNLANGNGRVSPRQVILFLILARDASTTGDKAADPFPIFRRQPITAAMTKLSELSYSEVVNDFRIATTFVRNCRAGKLKQFKLEDVQGLFDLDQGSLAEQVELLERLGFLERIVVQTDGDLETYFRVPSLFTRCWDQAAG